MNLGSPPHGPGATGVPASLGGATAYRLGTRLGRAGEVYEADHPRLEGRVALKLYRRAAGVAATVTDAFCREATRASGLRHPHIAHVIDAGTFADGTPFMAVEFLNGQTLEERMVGRGAFLATELLPLIRGTASALSAAHAAGVFHRELRPDNIFITDLAGYEQGFVKVLDFGVCHLTAAQIAGGRDLGLRTTRYFAPEQLSGHLAHSDARSDQFALAAIAFRMLNGTDPPAIHAGRAGDARPGGASTLARRAPAVDAVVSKGLNRHPDDRFESVALFLRAFEEALTGAALISTPGPVRQATDHVHPAAVHVVPTTAAVRPRHPSPLANFPLSHEIDPASLSDRFFAEGEHQEATRFKNLPHADDSGPVDDAHLDFDSFDRIPTRRKPLIIAVLLLIGGGAAAAWWAGVRPPESWQQSELWQRLHLPHLTAAVPPPAAPVVPEPIPAPPPRIAAPVPAAPPAAAAAPVGAAPTTAEVAAPPVPAPSTPEPAPATAAAPTPAPAPEQPTTAPVTPSGAAPPVTPESQPAKSTVPAAPAGAPVVVAIPPQSPPEKKRVRTPARSETSRKRSGPLMLWSPEKQTMVPADQVGGGGSWSPVTPSGHSEPWPRANPATPSPPPVFQTGSGPAPPPFRP